MNEEEEKVQTEIQVIQGVALYQEMVKLCMDKSAMSVMLAISGLLDDIKGYLVDQHGNVDVVAVLADTMVLWETLKDKMNKEFAQGNKPS